jgi:hypothetical protein
MFEFEIYRFFGGGRETTVWTQGFAITKHVLYYLSNTSSPLFCGYFGDGLSQTICLSWPWVSAFQIIRITDVSHWHQVKYRAIEDDTLIELTSKTPNAPQWGVYISLVQISTSPTISLKYFWASMVWIRTLLLIRNKEWWGNQLDLEADHLPRYKCLSEKLE